MIKRIFDDVTFAIFAAELIIGGALIGWFVFQTAIMWANRLTNTGANHGAQKSIYDLS